MYITEYINSNIKINFKLDIITHACNCSTHEVEAGALLWDSEHTGLSSDFYVSLGYTELSCLMYVCVE